MDNKISVVAYSEARRLNIKVPVSLEGPGLADPDLGLNVVRLALGIPIGWFASRDFANG